MSDLMILYLIIGV